MSPSDGALPLGVFRYPCLSTCLTRYMNVSTGYDKFLIPLGRPHSGGVRPSSASWRTQGIRYPGSLLFQGDQGFTARNARNYTDRLGAGLEHGGLIPNAKEKGQCTSAYHHHYIDLAPSPTWS